MFYITIFIELFKLDITKIFNTLILLFKTDRISELGIENQEVINEAKEIFNLIISNPEKELIKFEKKYSNILYTIIFFFNYYYQKEKIYIMLDNDNINKNLFEYILHNPKYISTLNLSKELLDKFIKQANNFSETKVILKYNNNCFDLLFAINENKELIFNIYNLQKEKIEKNKKINYEEIVPIKIEEYTQLKENDLINIIGFIKEIIHEQNEKKIKIISFSSNFFQKYLDDYAKDNLGNLLLVQNIVHFLKENDKGFEFKNFDNIIHKMGLKLIEEKRPQNNEILDFIQRDVYTFTHKKFQKTFDLNILKGIKIKEINMDFIENWKKIEWTQIYNGQEEQFFKTVCSLVEDIDHFQFLFNLLYENNKFENDKVTILKVMQS